jgi:hypothetical protein
MNICVLVFDLFWLMFLDNLHDIGRYEKEYLRVMEHWRSKIARPWRNDAYVKFSVPDGADADGDRDQLVPMLTIHYEDLVANLESETRRILRYIGLEWDDAVLSFYNSSRIVPTASSFQVLKPIYGTSVDRWKHYHKWLGPFYDGLEGKLRPSSLPPTL